MKRKPGAQRNHACRFRVTPFGSQKTRWRATIHSKHAAVQNSDDCRECGATFAVSASARLAPIRRTRHSLNLAAIMIIPLEIVLALAGVTVFFALVVAVAAD